MRFFFYGTLIAASGNPLAGRLHDKLETGKPGHTTGKLFAVPDPLGWYPALVADPGGGKVHGMVHETRSDFSEADLAELDTYELYSPDAPDVSEYVRREVTVHLAQIGREVEAVAYVWAKPVDSALLAIPSGDFRAFLAERGETAFGASAG